MRWVDPETELEKRESTKTKLRRDAERIQRSTEKALNEGTYYKVVKTAWSDFRERYETEVIPGMQTIPQKSFPFHSIMLRKRLTQRH